MSNASSQMQRLAGRLIDYEAPLRSPSSDAVRHAVIDELRPHLVNLMGMGGFRGLLSRAIVLAGEEARWLRAVHVTADGSLSGLEEFPSLEPGQFAEGKIILLAELLGMMVALIGVGLTLRVVLDIWPKIPLDDLDFGNGGTDETEK
jgi:hypothetical protein